MAEFIAQIFAGDEAKEEFAVSFHPQSFGSGPALNCGTKLTYNLVAVAGREGAFQVIDASKGSIGRISGPDHFDILSIAELERGRYALGTTEGLRTMGTDGGVLGEPSITEPVSSLAMMPWGGGSVVTGSRDNVRQFNFDTLSERRYHSVRDIRRKFGTVVKLIPNGNELIIAAGQEVLVLDARFEVATRVPVHFQITDAALAGDGSLVVCGQGTLAHVSLYRGAFARSLPASGSAKYTAVHLLREGLVCTGTDEGVLGAVAIDSGEEVGTLTLPFPIRGIVPVEGKLVVYGGARHSTSRTSALVNWKERGPSGRPEATTN